MAAPYLPLAIANTFIERFAPAADIEHMKLQKLVYCAYGWWLATQGMNAPRLTTEGPQIWQHGPVFNSLYQTLKVYGRQSITSAQSQTPFQPPLTVNADDADAHTLINWVWARYGHLSGLALSDMTHKPGSPWYRMAQENGFRIARNTPINDQYIYDEFQGLITNPAMGNIA